METKTGLTKTDTLAIEGFNQLTDCALVAALFDKEFLENTALLIGE